MSSPTAALLAGFDYVRRNPFALVAAAKNAAQLRLTVPLDVVRWGLGKIRSKAVGDFAVSSSPPGLLLELTASAMGAKVGIKAVITIEELTLGPGLFRVSLRVTNLAIEPQGAAGGPIQALLASGAIDLSKPGNLLGFLPTKPAIVVEADGDRFVLDLLQVKSLRENAMLLRALTLVTPVLTIRDVLTEHDALLIGLRVRPSGLPLVLASLRS
ncbi:MAG: hypothetical protein ABI321_21395 [Polyangia bacterium]